MGWTSGPIPQISGGGGDSLEPSGWDEPSPQSISRKMEIDDGTSAWGDPTRYNNKNLNLWDKNGKSVESWGGKGDSSIAASRHPSWEEDDDGGGGVWNSTGSQGSGSSFNSGGWGQTHGGKRGNIKSGPGESWMNPVTRQFSNMGLMMEGDKRGISDYNGDMRRGGRGGGGYRMPSSKDMGAVDMGLYGEKVGGHGAFVPGGGGMSQSRGMHQPGMHPMNPSQGLRAQVPHQFLSPQGGMFPPQISPQQLAMLSNINPHMQQFHLACQLLLQQQQQQQQLLQNQRKFPQPQPLRQQTDPQQFQPGVPWKGIQSSGDPESDPYMTPGSVLGSPGSPNLNDPDHPLLRDNIQNPSLNTSLPSSGAWPYSASDSPLSNAHSTKYSEYKPSWPPEPIGQNKYWKTNRNSSQLPRPPPGLTSQKQASPSPWGSAGPRLARSWGGWSDGVSSRGSCWLLLSNLTPQIDGSTLRTICMQHGPLLTFHLGLTQGSALIRYNSRQEAAKAQSALHCVLGNTTILAEFVSEEEVSRYFAHSQAGGAEGVSSGGAAGGGGAPGSSGASTAVGSSDRSSPGSERAAVGAPSGGNGNSVAGGESGAGVLAGVRSSGSAWQSLDGTGTSSETSSAQGPGLAIFSQWSTNGAGEGGGVGGVESGRSGLWGGMSTGYSSSSSLWGAPQMEERHQIDNSAGLLPGDLL
uniref:Trinucleotide repeat containing adaptor 6Bb.1 n=1 Tax=Kryptolebias marmoratus TaxID=37003 RepID=A0A3Q3ASD5_KRYMA